jgi:hypothetical protein
MPPSVASATLIKRLAHTTEKPASHRPKGVFSGACCTNSTHRIQPRCDGVPASRCCHFLFQIQYLDVIVPRAETHPALRADRVRSATARENQSHPSPTRMARLYARSALWTAHDSVPRNQFRDKCADTARRPLEGDAVPKWKESKDLSAGWRRVRTKVRTRSQQRDGATAREGAPAEALSEAKLP